MILFFLGTFHCNKTNVDEKSFNVVNVDLKLSKSYDPLSSVQDILNLLKSILPSKRSIVL